MARSAKVVEVLNATEAAGLLRVSESTVKRMAVRGELPAVKVGKAWRFNRELLIAYSKGEWHPEA